MRKRLAIACLVLFTCLAAAFAFLQYLHSQLHPIASVAGTPNDPQRYELLSARNGNFVFRPVDQSWNAYHRDIYGVTAVERHEWTGPRRITLTLRLGPHPLMAEVDGFSGSIRVYDPDSATTPATSQLADPLRGPG